MLVIRGISFLPSSLIYCGKVPRLYWHGAEIEMRKYIAALAVLLVSIAGFLPRSFAQVTQQKLTGSDSVAYDFFGDSVAISGDYAIVGAAGDDDKGNASGSAYIFQRSGGSWTQVAKLTASDGLAGDYFGCSAAIAGDYAIVGANEAKRNGIRIGLAYIFQRSDSTWNEVAKLAAGDGADLDNFGASVAISGDYAIVGALDDDDKSNDSGSAYIFHRSGSSWTRVAKLTASDGAAYDFFGGSVAISGDYAIVGAAGDDDKGEQSGSAYVFHRSGSSWTQAAKLTASDGVGCDNFGQSVAIFGDFAVVGTVDDCDRGVAGSAYIFQRSGGSWTQMAKLTASDGSADDFFGESVAISGDYVIVGAAGDDDKGEQSGSAYIFHRNGSSWTQTAKLTARDGAAHDFFGESVAISGDYVIVGAAGDDDKGEQSGSAYVFSFNFQPPSSPTSPNPLHTTAGICTTPVLSWSDDSRATSYDIYFGTDAAPDSSELIGNQASRWFRPGRLATNTTYYWRVDAKNQFGTTTGEVWSFATGNKPCVRVMPWIE
jgi:hypothetical protein